jgi:hypothetical protein
VVAYQNFVPLRQAQPTSLNELFMAMYHVERFINAGFIIEIAT